MNHFYAKATSIVLSVAAGLLFFITPLLAQNDAADVFKAKCAACHGADGSGNTAVGKSMKIRDFHSPDVQKQTDAQLTDIITTGKSAMPSYKGKLADDQIKQLVGYIREFGKK
jgi:cytochrome c6